MKLPVFAVLFSCVAVLLCGQVSAAAYTDDIDSLGSDTVKQYSGLIPYSFGNAASVVPDSTAAALSGGRLTAYSQYRATGATSVVASIYSQYGTFVCQNPENQTYMMGVFLDRMESVAGPTPPQALYCESSDTVYTYEGGLKQMYTDLQSCYFGGVKTPPSGELIGYGVNIYYSLDGQKFIRAEARMQSWQVITIGICYERYTAAVPESAKYIRVEINDVRSIPLADGGAVEKGDGRKTRLASVIITGDKLVMGESEPKAEAALPVGSQKPSVSGSYDAAKSASSKTAAKKSEESATTAKSSSQSGEASSKFEGTITSSSKPERASSPKPERNSGSKATESPASSANQPEQIEIPPNETIVHTIGRVTDESNFDKGVTAFMIIVSGGIVVLLALNKPKK